MSSQTAEVVITFELAERRACCRTLLYNGTFRERSYPTTEPISDAYAGDLVSRFVEELP